MPLKLAPDEESEWAPELEATDALLANLPTSSEDQLQDAVEQLRDLERGVSDERRALFGVIDRIDQELALRLSSQ